MSGKIVYIIGAGASKEVGFPTGEELKKNIQNPYYNNRSAYELINEKKIISAFSLIFKSEGTQKERQKVKKYFDTYSIIRKGIHLTKSIDTFLDNHRNDKIIERWGKLSVVQNILNAEIENKSQLLLPGRLRNAWLVPFYRNISEGCDKNEIKDRFKKISFIIFNYDRCVEYFLLNALSTHYTINESEAVEILNQLEIYHPYGCIGKLTPFDKNGVDFGENPKPEKLLEISNNIRTFTEGTSEETSQIIELKKIMTNAEKVIFLGFAFHKMNMEILKPNPPASSYPKFYASTYGFSDYDKNEIKQEIRKLYYNRGIGYAEAQFFMSNKDQTCFDFFNEFQKGLSF